MGPMTGERFAAWVAGSEPGESATYGSGQYHAALPADLRQEIAKAQAKGLITCVTKRQKRWGFDFIAQRTKPR